MSRNILFAEGEFYHVYNRGTERRSIFETDYDYRRFQALLYICNSTKNVDLKSQGSTLRDLQHINRESPLVAICSYCLMPNHIHLVLHEITAGGISRFMQKVTTAYTMYFNALHERSGALFQGRFKAKHANDTEYLKYLVAYVHLNPIKLMQHDWKDIGITNLDEACDFLSDYRYSSYLDYSHIDRLEKSILNREPLLEIVEHEWDFVGHVEHWLTYPQQGSTL